MNTEIKKVLKTLRKFTPRNASEALVLTGLIAFFFMWLLLVWS